MEMQGVIESKRLVHPILEEELDWNPEHKFSIFHLKLERLSATSLLI